MDDSGYRKMNENRRYLALGGFSVASDEVHQLANLRNDVFRTVPGLGLPGDELKFSHIGRTTNTLQSPNPLIRQGLDLQARIQIVMKSLEFLNKIQSLEIIVAIVDQKHSFGASPIEHAMRVLLERIQFSFSELGQFGIVISDEEQKERNHLRDIHTLELSQYMNYKNIIETIMFVPSHLSHGVQFADLVTGSVARLINHEDPKYFNLIKDKFRKNYAGEIQGYGLAVFPKIGYREINILLQNGLN